MPSMAPSEQTTSTSGEASHVQRPGSPEMVASGVRDSTSPIDNFHKDEKTQAEGDCTRMDDPVGPPDDGSEHRESVEHAENAESGDDPDTDLEYEIGVANQLAADTDPYYSNTSRPLTERRKDAKKRSLQAAQYLTLVEDRLRELERAVRDLKAERNPEEESSSEAARSKSVQILSLPLPSEPSRLLWKDFFTRNNKSPWAIDFLVEPPYSFNEDYALANRRGRLRQSSPGGIHQTNIERVKLKWCDDISVAEELLGDGGWNVIGEHVKPYKAIVPFLGKLVAGLGEIDNQIVAIPVSSPLTPVPVPSQDDVAGDGSTKISTHDEPVSPDTVPDRPAKDVLPNGASTLDPAAGYQDNVDAKDLSQGRQNLQEKRLWLSSFIDNLNIGLTDEIKAYDRLRSRSHTTDLGKPSARVTFQELWYLYAPGDLVYWHVETQALRILAVRGGRARLAQETDIPFTQPVPISNDSKAPLPARFLRAVDDVSDFVITCFSLDSNGTMVGPVQTELVIEHFEGTREISDFIFVPMEYAIRQSYQTGPNRSGISSDQHDLQSFLLDRGKSFANLAHSGELGRCSMSVCWSLETNPGFSTPGL